MEASSGGAMAPPPSKPVHRRAHQKPAKPSKGKAGLPALALQGRASSQALNRVLGRTQRDVGPSQVPLSVRRMADSQTSNHKSELRAPSLPTAKTMQRVVAFFDQDSGEETVITACGGELVQWKRMGSAPQRTQGQRLCVAAHPHIVTAMQFAPDGKTVLVGNSCGEVCLVDVDRFEMFSRFWVSFDAQSPVHDAAAAVAGGEALASPKSPGDGPRRRSPSLGGADDARVLVHKDFVDEVVNVWFLSGLRCAVCLRQGVVLVSYGEGAEFGNRHAVGAQGDLGLAPALPEPCVLKRLECARFGGLIRCAQPYGVYTPQFVTGSSDGSLRLWSIDDTEPECVVERAHEGAVHSMCYSKTHGILVTAGGDRTINVWAGDTLESTTRIHAHHGRAAAGDITSVKFHPSSDLFVTVSDSGTVQYWSLHSFQLLSMIRNAHTSGVNDAAFVLPNGTELLTVGNDLNLCTWSSLVLTKIEHEFHPTGSVITSATAVWKGCIITTTITGSLEVWRASGSGSGGSTARQRKLAELNVEGVPFPSPPNEDHDGVVWGVAWCEESSTLVSVSSDGSIILWGHKPGELLPEFRSRIPNAHSGRQSAHRPSVGQRESVRVREVGWDVFAVAFSPGGSLFVTGSELGELRVWTTKSGAPWLSDQRFECACRRAVLCLAFVTDSLLVVGHAGTAVSLVRVDHKQRKFWRLQSDDKRHSGDVRSVCCVREEWVFTGGADSVVNVWQLATDHASSPSPLVHRCAISDSNGVVRDLRVQLENERVLLFVASDFDGLRVYAMGLDSKRGSVKKTLLVHIEEGTCAMALQDDFLLTCHGCHVLAWQWKQLRELPSCLQPLDGSQQSAVSVIRLPHLWKVPKDSATVWQQDAKVQVHHICVPQLADLDEYEDETSQAVACLPFLAGALIQGIVMPTGSEKTQHTSLSNLKLLRRICALCEQSGTIYLRPDPAFEWGDNSKDGLVLALDRGDRQVVEVLLNTLQRIWLHQSMAFVFTAEHMRLLLDRFPDLLISFLRSAQPHGTTELSIEKSPLYVVNECRSLCVDKKRFVRSSLGKQPHNFWPQRRGELGERRGGSGLEVRYHAYTLGIRNAVTEGRDILKAALGVRDVEVASQVFNLKTITFLEKFQAYELEGRRGYRRHLLLYGLHVALFVALCFFIASGTSPYDSSARGVAALLVSALSSLSAMRLVVVEARQLQAHGFREYFVRDNWNKLDTVLLVVHAVVIGLFFAERVAIAARVAAVELVVVFVKLVSYLRLFRQFSFLLRALFQIMHDVRAFVIILFLAVAGYGLAMYVVFQHIENDNGDEPGSNFETVGKALMSSFSMLLGNFNELTFVDSEASTITTILFCAYMFVGYITMLTVLISIVSDTFLAVKQRSRYEGRKERTSMLLEHTQSASHNCWLQVLSSEEGVSDKRELNGRRAHRSPVDHNAESEVVRLRALVERLQLALGDSVHHKKALGPQQSLEHTPSDSKLPLTGLVIIPTKLDFVVRSFQACVYEVRLAESGRRRYLDFLSDLGVLNTGQFSPPALVTIDTQQARRKLLIPLDAHAFALAYPLVGADHLSEEVKQRLAIADPIYCFLLYGGFVYFDKLWEPIRANAFLGGSAGMHFDGPYKWPSRDLSADLHNQNRFRNVTIEALTAEGARRYAWINPGEELTGADGTRWKSNIEHGGFVYLYHDAPLMHDERDCYFVVKAASDGPQDGGEGGEGGDAHQ